MNDLSELSDRNKGPSGYPVARSPWLFGPTIDLVLGCGAWSLPLLLAGWWLTKSHAVLISVSAYAFAIFCNQPHYMATVYRAYRSPRDYNKYRIFTVYLTVLLIATLLLVHFFPAAFPYVLTLYLTWSPWHYTGQNYGIAMMLAKRAGATPTNDERNLLWWSYVASYISWFLSIHAPRETSSSLVVLGINYEFGHWAQLFCAVLFCVAGSYALFRLSRQVGWRSLAGPITLQFSQLLWFVIPIFLKGFTTLDFSAAYFSVGVLAFMHCAQYLWVTTYFARKEAAVTPARTGGAGQFAFWRYYGILVIGGIALFIPGPWIASRVFHFDLVESFLIFTALVNLHHFILDGAIWKLRDGRIARLLIGRNAPHVENQIPGTLPDLPWQWLIGGTRAAKQLRWALVAAMIGIGLLDQIQYALTVPTAALRKLDAAQRLNPADTRVYFRRAQLAVASGKTTVAIEELNKAIAISPHNAAAQHLLGELLFKTGDTKAALAHYDRMAALFRPDVVVLMNDGLLAREQGEYTKSSARLEAALRVAPHNIDLHYVLGESYEKQGDSSRAVLQYELFAELFESESQTPQSTELYLQVGLKLGDYYNKKGLYTKSRAWYERVVAVGGKNYPALTAQAQSQLSSR